MCPSTVSDVVEPFSGAESVGKLPLIATSQSSAPMRMYSETRRPAAGDLVEGDRASGQQRGWCDGLGSTLVSAYREVDHRLGRRRLPSESTNLDLVHPRTSASEAAARPVRTAPSM